MALSATFSLWFSWSLILAWRASSCSCCRVRFSLRAWSSFCFSSCHFALCSVNMAVWRCCSCSRTRFTSCTLSRSSLLTFERVQPKSVNQAAHIPRKPSRQIYDPEHTPLLKSQKQCVVVQHELINLLKTALKLAGSLWSSLIFYFGDVSFAHVIMEFSPKR